MWPPSPATDGNTNTKTKARASSSSSSSSYFSRSSSSSSSVAVPQTPKRKTMEEVWNGINLAHDSLPPVASSDGQRHFYHNMILQDFLACGIKSPQSSAVHSEMPQLPLPLTALSLSSGLGRPARPPNFPLHAAASSPFSSYARKRPLDDVPSCVAGGDHHYKRMMKNRESAARSRARKQLSPLSSLTTDECELKQAYTSELELEMSRLVEENANLKKQNEELRVAMTAQIPKKNSLQRSSSAPF